MSIALSVAFHGALLALAPRVTLLPMAAYPEQLVRRFNIELFRPESVIIEEQIVEARHAGLITRPDSIEDLLRRDNEKARTSETLLRQTVEVPRLAERVAAEDLDREHDLTPDPDLLSRMDARIIEITESAARRDVEVPRRLVRPSPSRILPADAFPVLRSSQEEGLVDVMLIDSPAGSGQAGSGGPAASSVEPEDESAHPVQVPDEDILKPAPAERSLPELPAEPVVVREAVLEEVKRERPYEFMDELVDIKVDSYMPSGDEKGFFKLRIIPKAKSNIEVLPKDITFVIDASSSILQRKLNHTTAGLEQVIAALRPEDRFNVVVFRDAPQQFQPAPVSATEENKQGALGFISNLESFGETDVYQAIRPVVLESPRPGVPGIVVLMSDGRPTKGVRDGRTIINALTAENEGRQAIFALSGGGGVNRYLLDLLAYRNKGASFVTGTIEEIQQAVPRFLGQVSDPILVDCEADYGRINQDEVFPKEIPGFYRGRPVTIYGRFDPAKDHSLVMRLKGLAGSREKEVVFQTDLAAAATGEAEIARNWAFHKIYYLIGEICRIGEDPALLSELRHLSEEYRIKTSYDE